MNLRPLIRSLLFLGAGTLAGFGFRQCRSLETISPVAAAPAIPAAAPASAPDPAKIRAAARLWFDANKRKTPPTYDNYELIESPPTREIDRIEALTSAGLREWLEEGRANGADGRLMDMLMERWGEVDMPAFIAWIEFLATQPRPRLEHPNIGSHRAFPDTNPAWFSAARAVLKRMDPSAKIPRGPGDPLEFNPAGTQITILSTHPADLRPSPPQPDLYSLSPEEALRELARRNTQMHELTEVVRRLAQKDHRAAFEWAKALPKNLRERLQAMKLAMTKGADDAPWILENAPLLKKEDDIKYALTNSAALYASQKGRASVMDWLLLRTEPAERRAGVGMLADRMHSMNIPEATGLLSRLTDRAERSRFLDAMLLRFGDDKDSGKLLDLIAAEPAGGNESLGAGAAAYHIAEKKSVKEALAWAETLPADGRRAAALAAAYSEWTRRTPDAALRAALALPPGDERTAVCTQAAITRSEHDAAAALQFSQSLGPDERAAIFPQLAEKLRSHQSAEARAEAVWLLTQRPALAGDSKFAESMDSLLPDTSTPTGARTARDWVNQLPAGNLRSRLENQIPRQ